MDNDSYLSEHAKIENNMGAIIRIIFEYNAENIKPGTGIHIFFQNAKMCKKSGYNTSYRFSNTKQTKNGGHDPYLL